jgi:glycosyltransferase involved in cell wall biosynthesis
MHSVTTCVYDVIQNKRKLQLQNFDYNIVSMRIGIEVQHMFRPRKHGMDIVILEILKELQESSSKHEFYLYAQPNKYEATLSIKENMHLQVAGPAAHHTWEQQLLPKAIKYDNINLLHCTSNTAPVGLKVPLIVTIHDLIYLEKCMTSHGTWNQRFGSLYRRWNVPKIAKTAEYVITVSEYERERIIDCLKIAPGKVKTIYSACSKHFTATRNETTLALFKAKYQLPDCFVLLLGNTGPKKNLPNIMRAINILHAQGKLHFKLVMADITRSRLMALLKAQGFEHLMEHIHLTGYVPNIEMPNLYQLAQLFLYPSLYESFGIPILESMACGTPVITSNTSAMPEVAGKDALFIDPTKPCEIAAMITAVLENSILRQQAIQYGIKRAKLFSLQRTAAEIVKVYESIIN